MRRFSFVVCAVTVLLFFCSSDSYIRQSVAQQIIVLEADSTQLGGTLVESGQVRGEEETRIARPYLGLNVAPDSLGRGLYVLSVIPGSPVDGILQTGMIITSINGKRLSSAQQLSEIIAESNLESKTVNGESFEHVDRNQVRVAALDSLGQMTEYELGFGQMIGLEKIGIAVGTSPTSDGFVVVAVEPNSVAKQCPSELGGVFDIEVGDQILAVNGVKMNSLDSISEALSNLSSSIKVEVQDVRDRNVRRSLTIERSVAHLQFNEFDAVGWEADAATGQGELVVAEPEVATPDGARQFTGKIVFNDFEGGFYGIVTDDGQSFNPTNLPMEFRRNGLRVTGTLSPRSDSMSTRMWGTIADIVEIACAQ